MVESVHSTHMNLCHSQELSTVLLGLLRVPRPIRRLTSLSLSHLPSLTLILHTLLSLSRAVVLHRGIYMHPHVCSANTAWSIPMPPCYERLPPRCVRWCWLRIQATLHFIGCCLSTSIYCWCLVCTLPQLSGLLVAAYLCVMCLMPHKELHVL